MLSNEWELHVRMLEKGKYLKRNTYERSSHNLFGGRKLKFFAKVRNREERKDLPPFIGEILGSR